MRISSWGGVSGDIEQLFRPAFSTDLRNRVLAADWKGSKCLVVGNLRSYGDEVISPEGNYVQTTRCDRILSIDQREQTLTAESGVRLDILRRRLAPLGFILPVTPGTAHLTLGGAIANDVHGKNHHTAGTFGRFVQKFELVRTDGDALLCSATQNPDYFAATIGGMGLTGAITWATIRIRRMESPLLRVVSRRFRTLAQFFDLERGAEGRHEYAVAWIDCSARGRSLGRGIYSVADHLPADAQLSPMTFQERHSRLTVPFEFPISAVNSVTLPVINSLYFLAHRVGARDVRASDWLYPLDSVGHWNRLYGRRGFYQFQCVVPAARAPDAIAEMLQAISAAKQGSFLVVLKNFGDKPSPGWMSFPMAGTTLALDFPNLGAVTRNLLLELHRITAAAQGRLYPAKDAFSPADSLERGYPHFAKFKRMVDPGFDSMMAQRLGLTG
jgi:L-gulonolactone oxidase